MITSAATAKQSATPIAENAKDLLQSRREERTAPAPIDPKAVFAKADQEDAEKLARMAKASAVAGATLEIVGQVAGIAAEGILNSIAPGAGTAISKGAQVVVKGLSSQAGVMIKEGVKIAGQGFAIAANAKSEQAGGKGMADVALNTAGRVLKDGKEVAADWEQRRKEATK